ncbi:MAG TPA: TRAP transporter substrate-binding protein [Xanthobacteraceae bacterium]|nr:TRAP transporter substrate-binding protein [Xanthobacteraceae bacterium]
MPYRRVLFAVAALTLAASAAHAEDKKINLKLSYWVPPSHLLTPGYKEWAEALTKASNGSITVTLYPSSQLGSGADHYDMVKRGIADFGLINPGYTPGRFPVIGVSDLPFLSTDSLKAAPALTRWYKKYAAKEMPEHYVCHVFTHEPGTFHSKKEIKVPADVKGLNVRTANQTIAQYVTSMGGNSIQVPIMEAYETLKRGLADAITVPWGGLTHPAFKFGTVTEYTLDAPLYVSTFTHGISRALYDSMSESQKKAVDSVCTPEWAAKIYRHWYADDSGRERAIRKTDRKITKIGPQEVALWRKAAEPVVATWKESVKKAGYNPDEVLDEFKSGLKSVDALF